MIIFEDGIQVTQAEYKCLLHMVDNPDQWMRDTLAEKIRLRYDALVREWQPKFEADPSVDNIPIGTEDELVEFIAARPEFQTRLEFDASLPEPEPLHKNATALYNAKVRTDTVTLIPSGITLSTTAVTCLLAYLQDIQDWVLAGLIGQIERGKKKMVKQYRPLLIADPAVTTMPASEDGLINMIVARSDYQRLGG